MSQITATAQDFIAASERHYGPVKLTKLTVTAAADFGNGESSTFIGR